MHRDIDAIRKRQLRFALSVGIPYFGLLIGMFLLVYEAKEAVISMVIAGLPLHYWLVAVAVYPLTWGLFIWYVGKANAMEDEMADAMAALDESRFEAPGGAQPANSEGGL